MLLFKNSGCLKLVKVLALHNHFAQEKLISSSKPQQGHGLVRKHKRKAQRNSLPHLTAKRKRSLVPHSITPIIKDITVFIKLLKIDCPWPELPEPLRCLCLFSRNVLNLTAKHICLPNKHSTSCFNGSTILIQRDM